MKVSKDYYPVRGLKHEFIYVIMDLCKSFQRLLPRKGTETLINLGRIHQASICFQRLLPRKGTETFAPSPRQGVAVKFPKTITP